jgi:hypothetical protein
MKVYSYEFEPEYRSDRLIDPDNSENTAPYGSYVSVTDLITAFEDKDFIGITDIIKSLKQNI